MTTTTGSIPHYGSFLKPFCCVQKGFFSYTLNFIRIIIAQFEHK
ncbi:hypothetical protein Hsw_1238 [Hymenobacter swuensis DY53]|uniref:Uncharacterized protein n=1 Tax=Hymenobacter swuensis DY53 TaxID=1227739 RepID=W8EW96_9BACT|nr:hypothetical protein Hsw_1238 [Hymenobacter swuensis DY53]